MRTTERQKEILNKIVTEYINSAQPVSSQIVKKKYHLDISPATIRIEMQRLTSAGFLYQPHTSAGRIPTDKGYRLFVNEILEGKLEDVKEEFNPEEIIKFNLTDTLKFIQYLTKNLAILSSALCLIYLFREKIFWKEGWEEILREPEFKEQKLIFNFAEFLENFERNVENFKEISGIKIFIGKEVSLPKARDFSTIISRCKFPKRKEGVLAILGPKRMAYQRNISFLNSLIKSLEEI